MTINSVTSNSGLYEAMVQQAAALRAAQENRSPAARTAQLQTGQSPVTQATVGKSPEPGNFAQSLSAQARLADQRPLAPPPPAQPPAQQLQKKVAGAYRSPWADANSLVVQTRSPGALAAPSSSEPTGVPAAPPEAETPKPTFVEVHSVYLDAADEESGRSSRNPLFRFASQLYQDVVATGRRSAAGEYIGSSLSSVA